MKLGRIHSKYTGEAFEELKDECLAFLEICCNNRADMERLLISKEEVRKNSERTGIDVASVGRWNHTLNVGGVLDEDEMKNYLDLIDCAVYLGARTFVAGINRDQTVSLYKNYTVAIEFFKRLISHADGRIKIAVQNCDWNNFIVSPKEWDVVLGELDELYIKYDPSHAYNRGDDYLAEISDYGERIAHFHVKGTTHAGKRKVDDPPAGMDDIKWRSVFAVLYSRGYDGDISIEPHSSIWKEERGKSGILFTKAFIESFIM